MKVQVRFFDVDTEAGEDYIVDLDNRVHKEKGKLRLLVKWVLAKRMLRQPKV